MVHLLTNESQSLTTTIQDMNEVMADLISCRVVVDSMLNPVQHIIETQNPPSSS